MNYLALTLFLLFSAVAAAEPVTLRVTTWNLQWFPGGRLGASIEEQERHIEQLRDEVARISPDVLLLQEIGSEAALEEMLRPLGPEWRIAIVSRFMQGNFISGQQVAIAAKFPVEAAWAEPWEKGWAGAPRGYAYAAFKVGTKRLAVYTLHLKSNLGNPPENTSKREDAIEQLLAHIDGGEERVMKPDAIIIGGDFNTDDPDSPTGQSAGERTFTLLRQAGFEWSFRGVPHGERITCPGKGRYPDACFDYFFTRGLGGPLSSVTRAEGSDHFPVVMDISLP